MTDAEWRLWYHLRAHRFFGLKFKRQKPIGPYIIDFACIEHLLIVELDGGQHADAVPYDTRRDQWLKAQGYTVLRFWNNDVLASTAEVLESIRLAALQAPSPAAQGAAPSPASGRGEQQG